MVVRRFVAAVVALLSLFALSAAGAGAGTAKSLNATLTGSAVWNALYFPSQFTIDGQVSKGKSKLGTYSGTLSAGAFGPCPDNPYGPDCAPVTGTITFALNGGSISTAVEPGGTAWELLPVPSQEGYVFELRLDVTSGTHAWASAAGTLALTYSTIRDNLSWDPLTDPGPCGFIDITTCPIFDSGTLTGTITR